ncbi:NnrS family protein [Pseudoalteromonas ulvae]|uniref:NnrS family protein n=1 Tax=Pseudoalteromonas ulvae TaxID=107327 RepID=A0A244CLV6_PSEDV|nr:NnrS family protein [Pseudoalteromonas ulvae]OUL55953.1 hypothetical protein B1199_19805 [Pseudoalteromonas ulvae]
MSKLVMPNGAENLHVVQTGWDHPLLSMAFRPLFLMASFGSIAALAVWLGVLFGGVSHARLLLTPVVWHGHEMIFAFAATVAAGFLLTAVQTWTGQKTLAAPHLLGLIFLWCIIRISFWSVEAEQAFLVIILQVLWWGWVIVQFARPIIATKNRRNYVFIGLLTVLMLANLAALIADVSGHVGFALHIMRTCVLLFTILIALLGGRVIPFFTRSGCAREGIVLEDKSAPKWLERLLPWVALAGTVSFFMSYFFTLTVSAGVWLLLVGCLHLARMMFWYPHKVRSIPLLWSLHLAYLLLAVGLILLGSSYFHSYFSFSTGLHVITLGSIGLMILSMMSRVSLGHTGRALVVRAAISLGFMLMLMATLSRFFLSVLNLHPAAWVVSACLWGVAFTMFCVVYLPILTQPRQS